MSTKILCDSKGGFREQLKELRVAPRERPLVHVSPLHERTWYSPTKGDARYAAGFVQDIQRISKWLAA